MSSLPSHPGHGTAPRATAHPWNGRSAGSAARDNLSMPVGPVPTAPPDPLDEVRRASRHGGYAVYLGASEGRFVFSRPESGVLVLGPPRSGKTTSIVVPNVLAACGPVVVASTKRDILDATYRARLRCGPCIVFDPGGEVAVPGGMQFVGWSPLHASRTVDGAVLTAQTMVRAARPAPTSGEQHWTERAEAVLAPLFHAGALVGAPFREVMSWIHTRDLHGALGILARADAEAPCEWLKGIERTDERERSGIWSTASGILAAYRSEAALRSTEREPFDPAAFAAAEGHAATLFVCATGRHQQHAGPLIAGMLDEIRAATYARHAQDAGTPGRPPLLVVLDELANIAPLPYLPEMVSEGGSQGLQTLACLQDLSQARARWGVAADGFFSLFGTKVVLPGIGDMRTLQAVSALAGEQDVSHRTAAPGSMLTRLAGRRGPSSWSTRREPRLPVDAVATGRPGRSLVVDGGSAPRFVWMTPYQLSSPWREAAGAAVPTLRRQPDRSVAPDRSAGRQHGRTRSSGPGLGR
jgi:type IV secretion system protein VirD4